MKLSLESKKEDLLSIVYILEKMYKQLSIDSDCKTTEILVLFMGIDNY